MSRAISRGPGSGAAFSRGVHRQWGLMPPYRRPVAVGHADRAMLPVENSLAGRVVDIHHLLPEAGLQIVAEHFPPIENHLMAQPGGAL